MKGIKACIRSRIDRQPRPVHPRPPVPPSPRPTAVAKLNADGTVTNTYLLDLAGHQVTELGVNGAWDHTNLWAGGRLLATHEGPGDGASRPVLA